MQSKRGNILATTASELRHDRRAGRGKTGATRPGVKSAGVRGSIVNVFDETRGDTSTPRLASSMSALLILAWQHVPRVGLFAH